MFDLFYKMYNEMYSETTLIFNIYTSPLVSKVGSECEVSYGTPPMEQTGLRVLLKDPTVAA